MTNYLLLYHGGGMPASEEEGKKVIAAWAEWMKQCGDSLVDAGNPCSNVKVVTKDAVSEFSGDQVTGYSVIKANNIDEAIKASQMVPLIVDGSGSVDVYETFAAM